MYDLIIKILRALLIALYGIFFVAVLVAIIGILVYLGMHLFALIW